MKHYVVGGLAAVLMAGGLITSSPPASAGCKDVRLGMGNQTAAQCDAPVQPDGTWQRCVNYPSSNLGVAGRSLGELPAHTTCQIMGPDQPKPIGPFGDPPTHIDDEPSN